MDLIASQIIEASDLAALKVTVNEWGGDVYIRLMTVGERDAHELEWLNNKEKGVDNFRSNFLARSLSDAKGVRLFSDAEVPLLSKKSCVVMHRLWTQAMAHNALSEEDVQQIAGE